MPGPRVSMADQGERASPLGRLQGGHLNLKLCAGTTRSSWSLVVTGVGECPGFRLCSGE